MFTNFGSRTRIWLIRARVCVGIPFYYRKKTQRVTWRRDKPFYLTRACRKSIKLSAKRDAFQTPKVSSTAQSVNYTLGYSLLFATLSPSHPVVRFQTPLELGPEHITGEAARFPPISGG